MAEMIWSREHIMPVEVDLLVLQGRKVFQVLVGDGEPSARR